MCRLVPTYWYSDLYAEMAATGHGMVVVSLDMLLSTIMDYPRASDVVVKTMEWVRHGGLERKLSDAFNGHIPFDLDVQHLLLGSHSSGAQSIIYALELMSKGSRSFL